MEINSFNIVQYLNEHSVLEIKGLRNQDSLEFIFKKTSENLDLIKENSLFEKAIRVLSLKNMNEFYANDKFSINILLILEDKELINSCKLFSYGETNDCSHLISKLVCCERRDRYSEIYRYCYFGDLKELENSLKNSLEKLNDCDDIGRTPLHIACLNGQKEIVEFLLNNNADVNSTDDDGFTPLFIACENGGSPKHVMLFFDYSHK